MATLQPKALPPTFQTVGSFPPPAGPGISSSPALTAFSGRLDYGPYVVTAEVDITSPGADPNGADAIGNSFSIVLTTPNGIAGTPLQFQGAGRWALPVSVQPNMLVTVTPTGNYRRISINQDLNPRA